MHVRAPSYRLHKPSGQAVVTLGGRDFYLGKHGTPESQAAYKRLLAEHLAGGAVAKKTPDLSINELLLAYIEHADGYYRRPDGSPTGEIDAIKGTLKPLRILYGLTRAAEFGPLALKAVRREMVESKRLSRGEVNKRCRHILRFFRWAAENELVPASVPVALKMVAGLKAGRTPGLRETEPVRPVAWEHVEAVRQHVQPSVRAMIDLQWLTGGWPTSASDARSCQ